MWDIELSQIGLVPRWGQQKGDELEGGLEKTMVVEWDATMEMRSDRRLVMMKARCSGPGKEL
jgi:hypothetical protein